VAQDPIRARKADRWDSLVNSGVSPDEATKAVEQEFAEQPAAPPQTLLGRAKKAYTDEMKKDVADFTAMFTNIPGAEEVGGAVTGLLPGGMNYQQGRQFVAQKREEAKGQMGGGRYTALSAVPSVALGVMTGGESILARALMSAGIEGTKGFLGAGARPVDAKAPTLGERTAAAISPAGAAGLGGAAVEGLLKIPAPLVRGVARVATKIPYGGPLVDAVTQGAKGTVQSAARSASDVLAKRAAPFLEGVERTLPFGMTRAMDAVEFAPSAVARALSRAIEPMDTQKIARLGAETLPGRAGSGAVGAINEASRKATASAKALETELAGAQTSVSEAGSRITGKAKSVEKQLTERATQESQTTLNQLKAEAEMTTSGLRSPVESADKLRENIVEKMREEAPIHYKKLAEFPVVERIDPVTGQAIAPMGAYKRLGSANLLDDLEAAAEAKGTRLFNERLAEAQAGVPEAERAFVSAPDVRMPRFKIGQRTNIQTGELEDVTVPKIDLEVLDNLRQNVNTRITAFFNGAETGLAPKAGKQLLNNIDEVEKMLIDAMEPEAKAAVLAARGPYRAKMVQLQALQDGLNLSKFGLSSSAKLKSGGVLDIGELEKTIAELYGKNPEAKAAFQVGAKEAIANLANSSTDDAIVLINNLVGTPLARRRTELALGKDAVESMQRFLQPQMERTAAAFAGPTVARAGRAVARGEERAAKFASRSQGRISELERLSSEQGRRAGQLESIANIPFEQIMAGGQPAETFANITSKQLGGFGDRAVPGVFGSILQSQIAGLTPKASLAKLMEMEANPAIRQQMGPQIRALIEQIQKKGTPDALKTARQLFVGQKAAELTR
jgi:hypothetical protein